MSEKNEGGVGGPLVGTCCLHESGVDHVRTPDDDGHLEFDVSDKPASGHDSVAVESGFDAFPVRLTAKPTDGITLETNNLTLIRDRGRPKVKGSDTATAL